MSRKTISTAITLALLSAAPAFAATKADYPIQPIPFTQVRYTSGVFADRQKVNLEQTIPYAQEHCQDRLKNFDLAVETLKRRANGEPNFQNKPITENPFDDSDVYKYLEGAFYAMQLNPDEKLHNDLKDIIKRVKAAQEPDGYLYTWRTMHPDSPVHSWIHEKRWLNDPDLSHELYNIGHFYECAVAYYEATGDRVLFDMALKSAELVYKDLGQPDSPVIAPGHQVIEMGLAKLYRYTGDERWIKLAAKFLENRSVNPPDFGINKTVGITYSQAHKPVLEQDEAVGHSVRAHYMYAGMADVAALSGDKRYMDAIDKIWNNVVWKKLHLTGGCGASYNGEAYGNNYELPSKCYNETCAAVAFLFWTHRMYLMHGDSYYMDVFERCLYNGSLAGVGLDGKRFFYTNVLEYEGSNNGNENPRKEWFGCACCPPNIMRTIASLGSYAYATKGDTLYTLLYAAGTGTWKDKNITITQDTNYPWDGKVNMTVKGSGKFNLALRVPGWVNGKPLPSDLYFYENPQAEAWTVTLNGKKVDYTMDKGFAVISNTWKDGDKLEINFPMTVRKVNAHKNVKELAGQVGFERGPIVFAFEQNDQQVKQRFHRWSVTKDAKVNAKFRPDLLGGIETIEVTDGNAKYLGVPYAWWANRGAYSMRVWLWERTANSANSKNKAPSAKISVSYNRGDIYPENINDGIYPEATFANAYDNFDFWNQFGGEQWISLTWDTPQDLSFCKFYWFDDSKDGGGCGLPVSWNLLYDKGGTWVPVKGIKKTDNSISFEKIATKALRVVIRQQENLSSGLYEWIAE